MNELSPLSMLSANTASEKSAGSVKDAKLKKACNDFEAYFVNEMFKSMRQTVPDSEFIKKNKGEKIYREMMDQEIAAKLSVEQSLGLSDNLYNQLKKDFKDNF